MRPVGEALPVATPFPALLLGDRNDAGPVALPDDFAVANLAHVDREAIIMVALSASRFRHDLARLRAALLVELILLREGPQPLRDAQPDLQLRLDGVDERRRIVPD